MSTTDTTDYAALTERAERDALAAIREDPRVREERLSNERQERDEAELDAARQRAIDEATAAELAAIPEREARAHAAQVAEETADEVRIATVLAMTSMMSKAEATLQPVIAGHLADLYAAIANEATNEELYGHWIALRAASSELWNTTSHCRRMIAASKGEDWKGAPYPDQYADLTFNDVCAMALAHRTTPTADAAAARVNETYMAAANDATALVAALHATPAVDADAEADDEAEPASTTATARASRSK